MTRPRALPPELEPTRPLAALIRAGGDQSAAGVDRNHGLSQKSTDHRVQPMATSTSGCSAGHDEPRPGGDDAAVADQVAGLVRRGRTSPACTEHPLGAREVDVRRRRATRRRRCHPRARARRTRRRTIGPASRTGRRARASCLRGHLARRMTLRITQVSRWLMANHPLSSLLNSQACSIHRRVGLPTRGGGELVLRVDRAGDDPLQHRADVGGHDVAPHEADEDGEASCREPRTARRGDRHDDADGPADTPRRMLMQR